MVQTKYLDTLDHLGCRYAFYHRPAAGEPFYRANHERFYSASMIKVPILLAWLHLEQAGLVCRDEICDLDAEPQVQGSGFAFQLRGRRLPYADVLLMMIAASDNLCTNLVIGRAGLARLNEVFRDALRLPGAQLQRKLFDYESRAQGLDNWITPGDCLRMYDLIAGLAPAERAWVDSLLLACVDSALLMRSIPRDTLNFYHKTGSITGVLHDWGYTDTDQIFLLTQDVPAEPPVFEVFGALGRLLLPDAA